MYSYYDTIVDIYSLLKTDGAEQVAKDLMDNYPELATELTTALQDLVKHRQTAKLLRE